ncbi:MAG: polysaccharide biosynthesis/export family protein [Myxococcaceae bacterium]
MPKKTWAILVALLGTGTGCKHSGLFVWVDQYKEPGSSRVEGYLIGNGDTLNVQVWNQPGVSGKARVRSDGRITIPFLNDVVAAGYTPNALALMIQVRLKEYINNPVVTLTLEESRTLSIPVVCEVAQEGVFNVEPGSGVLQAVSAGGGLGLHAREDYIFVLRRTSPASPPTRIRFTYDALTRAQGAASTFRLRQGDTVVVE